MAGDKFLLDPSERADRMRPGRDIVLLGSVRLSATCSFLQGSGGQSQQGESDEKGEKKLEDFVNADGGGIGEVLNRDRAIEGLLDGHIRLMTISQ